MCVPTLFRAIVVVAALSAHPALFLIFYWSRIFLEKAEKVAYQPCHVDSGIMQYRCKFRADNDLRFLS